ncbi:MAG TPA: ferritin-like domain-containing protein [Clostridia bacterium]|nr:ferritin-like domain-containing protein [Clostridia bacterium]
MADYHEEGLSLEAKNFSRALKSLKEEVEAIDWYHQRVDASDNQQLAAIMAHNRDEEIEHACMALEWLRRNMPEWDDAMKTFLFTSGDITTLEEEMESGEGGEREDSGERSSGGNSDLGIGKL